MALIRAHATLSALLLVQIVAVPAAAYQSAQERRWIDGMHRQERIVRAFAHYRHVMCRYSAQPWRWRC